MSKTGKLENAFVSESYIMKRRYSVFQFARGYLGNYINKIFTIFKSFQKFIHVMVLVFR